MAKKQIKQNNNNFAQEDKELMEIWGGVSVDEPHDKESADILRASAGEMQKRSVKISLRVNKYDLERIKARALREGVPYQTLLNSTLHRLAHEL